LIVSVGRVAPDGLRRAIAAPAARPAGPFAAAAFLT